MLHPPPKTLVVSNALEEIQDMSLQLAPYLELSHCSIVAVKALTNWPPIIIIHLHDDNPAASELIGYLRHQAPQTQLYVVSSNCSAERIIEAYEQGASGCLMLPLDPLKLMEKLSKQLETLTQSCKTKAIVQFLGRFSMKNSNGQFVNLTGRCDSIFACLLYHAQEGISRDRLINYFWPEVPEDSARNSLNVAISTIRAGLREVFAKRVVVFRNNRYYISPNLGLHSDLDEFTASLKHARALLRVGINNKEFETALTRVAKAYQGDFLPGFTYENWATDIRHHLWEEHLFALQHLLEYYMSNEQFEKAVETAKTILHKDECQEMTQRRLMYAYYRLGLRSKALQQYRRCEQNLIRELEILPSTETRELYEIIVQEEQKEIFAPLI